MKDSVRTDCQMYAKDFCGDDGIILFLGITASLAFRTIIAYSNHIPQAPVVRKPIKLSLD